MLQSEPAMNIVRSVSIQYYVFCVCVVREIKIYNSGNAAKCSGVKMEMLWMMDFFNIYTFNLQSFVAVFIYAVFRKRGGGMD